MPKDFTEIYTLYRLLAVCHTVVVDQDKNGEIIYQASSPDELALIQGAKQVGFTLIDKNTKTMTIKNEHTQRDEVYEILAEFPFDSTRKRMSLIVRFGSEIIHLCKGADNIMLPRINFDKRSDDKIQIMKDLLMFAKSGLRTLVVA
jgi:magnesium-transporting ATPase (P-type)